VTPTFVTIIVDEHDELPEGCCMRFKAIDTPRVVRLVRMDADRPTEQWSVEACGQDGRRGPAHGVTVEDSSAGSSTLVYGGAHGLRLRPVGGGEVVAEPYLLLADRAVVA